MSDKLILEKEEVNALRMIGGCLLLLLAVPFQILLRGWVLNVLWG